MILIELRQCELVRERRRIGIGRTNRREKALGEFVILAILRHASRDIRDLYVGWVGNNRRECCARFLFLFNVVVRAGKSSDGGRLRLDEGWYTRQQLDCTRVIVLL